MNFLRVFTIENNLVIVGLSSVNNSLVLGEDRFWEYCCDSDTTRLFSIEDIGWHVINSRLMVGQKILYQLPNRSYSNIPFLFWQTGLHTLRISHEGKASDATET